MGRIKGFFEKGWAVLQLLIRPMTATKAIKLCVLGFIFVANFEAWGNLFGNYLGMIIPFVGGGIGYILAIPAFSACQYCEAEPELLLLGCEPPEVNLDRVKLAPGNATYAGMVKLDAMEELGDVTPLDIARARSPQSFSFWIDLVVSGTAWFPFTTNLLLLLIAPTGFLDFNLWNLLMLVVTVFFTPRILVSAIKDGRFKAAKHVRGGTT